MKIIELTKHEKVSIILRTDEKEFLEYRVVDGYKPNTKEWYTSYYYTSDILEATKAFKEAIKNQDNHLIVVQRKIFEDIQNKLDISIVTCGNCGAVILVGTDQEEVQCHNCLNTLKSCDCPNLWN